jgi:hypothetical protein
MVRRSRRIVIFATLAVATSLFGSTFALGSTANSGNAASQGPPAHVASAFGRANIAGQETFVHVTVAGVSAESAEAAARAELGRRGAVPVQSAEYSKNGTWKQFGDNELGNDMVVLHYNPVGGPDYRAAIGGSTPSWNDVDSSSFAFSLDSNTTNTCPSLVDECPDSQEFNGANEAGWLDLGGVENNSITLGVTWYNFRTRGGPFAAPQETDMVLNSNGEIHWDAHEGYWLDIDSVTVAAHEFGHMAGLGHSSDKLALMYASYQDVVGPLLLGSDDIAGISALYPLADEGSGSTGNIPGYCKKHPTRAGCPSLP